VVDENINGDETSCDLEWSCWMSSLVEERHQGCHGLDHGAEIRIDGEVVGKVWVDGG
jgi:hypothetical protein